MQMYFKVKYSTTKPCTFILINCTGLKVFLKTAFSYLTRLSSRALNSRCFKIPFEIKDHIPYVSCFPKRLIYINDMHLLFRLPTKKTHHCFVGSNITIT